jgi:hypothetical protein
MSTKACSAWGNSGQRHGPRPGTACPTGPGQAVPGGSSEAYEPATEGTAKRRVDQLRLIHRALVGGRADRLCAHHRPLDRLLSKRFAKRFT